MPGPLSGIKVVERADLAADLRYATATSRSVNYETLYKELGEIIGQRTSAQWLACLKPLGIPVAPVNSLSDLFDDPHLQAIGTFVRMRHPSEGMLTQVKPPVNFEKTPGAITRLAPRLGEHSRELLAHAGLSEQEIAELAAAGATQRDSCAQQGSKQ